MFTYILAMPTPAIISSLPKCPAKDTFIDYIKKDDIIVIVEGTPTFMIFFNNSLYV